MSHVSIYELYSDLKVHNEPLWGMDIILHRVPKISVYNVAKESVENSQHSKQNHGKKWGFKVDDMETPNTILTFTTKKKTWIRGSSPVHGIPVTPVFFHVC